MRGGGIPAERGAFAFPHAKVDWRPTKVKTEQEKKDARVQELIAELRLYHHYEAAKELERLHREDVARRLTDNKS